ncbi:MAG: protein kinase [Deltaproteobacteria bacterium]|nr:protein kinase [Deltaproteobacteria bacterium]
MKPTDPSDPAEPKTAAGGGEGSTGAATVRGRAPATDELFTIPEPVGVPRSPHSLEPNPVDATAPKQSEASDATKSGKSPALANTERPPNNTVRGIPVEDGEPPSLPSYRVGELLGRGGMGEVVLADDLEIGRKVAIKRLRGDVTSEALVARFLREAKIQAVLDHPAIVPVHEVGRDSAGRPFFTMKRLQGTTLSEVIKTKSETRARMLRALADVCLAIELAHSRGFIHRDLKPSNIMLGEYGEVYVIDWGLARHYATGVDGEPDPGFVPDTGSLGGETQVGVVMGTPGYMSPEQVRGETVGPPTDVYALGVVLYEILTRRNLHPRGGDAALVSTLAGGNLSPAAAAPDRAVPPELDRLCVAALAFDAERRPTARALADGVQKYLDGDRDLERRRVLATELLVTARADLESDDPARRGSAIKAASRALALDPESEEAGALVAKMMLEPPKVMPPELAQRLDDIDVSQGSTQGKRASMSLAAYFLFLPIAIWMGVRDWGAVVMVFALVLTAIGTSLGRAKWPRLPMVIALVVNTALLMALGRLTSPLVIVPTLAVGAGILFGMFPQLLHRPVVVLGACLSSTLVPMALELAGVWSNTWQITDGQLVIDPGALDFSGAGAKVFLIGITAATAIVFPLFVRSLAIAQRAARRQLEIQAWHFQHLIPEARA